VSPRELSDDVLANYFREQPGEHPEYTGQYGPLECGRPGCVVPQAGIDALVGAGLARTLRVTCPRFPGAMLVLLTERGIERLRELSA